MTKYALDTNIISYLLKNDQKVIERFRQEITLGSEFVMLPVVYYEITRWLLERKAKNLLMQFNDFCAEMPFFETNISVWDKAAELYVQTRQKGRTVGSDADLLIAAYCIVNKCTLVTNNTRHFEIIDELTVTNWKF